jgi:hypothetical protein
MPHRAETILKARYTKKKYEHCWIKLIERENHPQIYNLNQSPSSSFSHLHLLPFFIELLSMIISITIFENVERWKEFHHFCSREKFQLPRLKANRHLHVLIEDSIASVRGRQLCLEQTHWRIQGDNSIQQAH